ncbi:MAG: hypothetical protein RR285_13545 [Acinetobacter sp.]
MYNNFSAVLDVIVFAITQGFIVFFFVGFISWAIWGVVSLFRSMVRG